MALPFLYDTYNRKHDYLRISLTESCNLRCMYCMPAETIKTSPHHKLMQVDEIEKLAGIFIANGIKKIRLTGGEPLVRKDAKEIIKRLSTFPAELTISTNALIVDEFIEDFKAANIKSVNVSLDTLNAQEFYEITRRTTFTKILSNIYLLLDEGFKVKVNMVAMRGVNEHVIPDFIEWTKNYPLEVRFIEFMPFAGNKWEDGKVLSYRDMLSLIEKKHRPVKLTDGIHDTTRKYAVPGHKGTFGFITTVTEPFCSSCNRLRLTADGKMKNCLFSEGEADLLSALRKGEDVLPLILSCLKTKKQERGGRIDFQNIENRSMIKIGG